MTDNKQQETISCDIEVYTVEQHGCEEWRGLRPYYPHGPYGTYGDTVADLPKLFEQLKADVPNPDKPWSFTVTRLYGADFDSVTLYFNYYGHDFYIADEGADDELIAAVEALNTGCKRQQYIDEGV